MNTLQRSLVATLALTLAAGTAAAQQIGNPVYYSPQHGLGFTIGLDYGRGLNDASTKSNYIGGRAILGLPFVTVSAGAGVVNPDEALITGAESDFTFGGTAAISLLSAPLLPVAVAVQAGVGYLKQSGTGGDITTLRVPVGAVLGLKVPNPAVRIEPWVAPRLDVTRTSNGTSNTETNFGVSAGINLGMSSGLGVHAVIDYLAVTTDIVGASNSDVSPFYVGAGVHFKLSVPGLGGF